MSLICARSRLRWTRPSRPALRIFTGPKSCSETGNGGPFEKQLNRAVFDVVAYSFAEPSIRSAALKSRPDAPQAFKRACEDDGFRNAIESTTKSKSAVRMRFSKRFELLSKAVGKKLHVALPLE